MIHLVSRRIPSGTDPKVPPRIAAQETRARHCSASPHHRSSSCKRGERRRNRPRPSFASALASLQAGWPASGHAASAPCPVRGILHGKQAAAATQLHVRLGQRTDVVAGDAALPAAGDASITFSFEPARCIASSDRCSACMKRLQSSTARLTGAGGAAGCRAAAAGARSGCSRPLLASLAGCPCVPGLARSGSVPLPGLAHSVKAPVQAHTQG